VCSVPTTLTAKTSQYLAISSLPQNMLVSIFIISVVEVRRSGLGVLEGKKLISGKILMKILKNLTVMIQAVLLINCRATR